MSLRDEIKATGERAQRAARELVYLSSDQKNQVLGAMAQEIDLQRQKIKEANQKDLRTGEKNGLSKAMLDRLELNDKRIDGMIQGISEVISLNDVIGAVLSENTRPNGLKIRKVRVPIGVIGIIYESRPNVTADAALLCIKSSNAVILKGGS